MAPLAGAALLACAAPGARVAPLPDWAALAVDATSCPSGTAPGVGALPDVGVVKCVTPAGVTHGWKASYWPNGRRAVFAEYRYGRPHGFTTGWHSSGRRRWQARWRDGRRDGRLTEWYPDGRVASTVVYRDGVKEGPQLDYYPGGHVMSVAHFRGGVQHGSVVAYHPNGVKQAEGGYRLGAAHGLWRYWDRSGRLDSAIAWRDGQEGGCCRTSR